MQKSIKVIIMIGLLFISGCGESSKIQKDANVSNNTCQTINPITGKCED